MTRLGAYELNPGQLLRLSATAAIAWAPAMTALGLLAWGKLSAPLGFLLGLAGIFASLAVIIVRIARPRRQPLSVSPEDLRAARDWRQVANPRDNYANRWAMYEDLSAWLSTRDWSGKVVAEFGGTNEILRHFIRGAEYRCLSYPEHDLQDLRGVADGTFDLAILDQTLEHIAHPERALSEVRRILKPSGIAIVTTPFLVPVHEGAGYGDYYRWTPQGLSVMMDRTGFETRVRGWGGRKAAAVLIEEDMYMSAEAALARGLVISAGESEAEFPVTVWAVGTVRH
jgi:SAM-dependent methyltransferase